MTSNRWDTYFFKQAYLTAAMSKDPRTQVGAVIVRGDNVISGGYNGFPRKVADFSDRLNDRDIKNQFVVHAEVNAILNAARYGTATLDTVMYTNGTPCHECMKAVIQAGIRRIYVHKEWEELFKQDSSWYKDSFKIATICQREADVPIKRCSFKLGVEILLNGKLTTL